MKPQHDLLQQTFGSAYVKMDACFKVEGDGITTLMDDRGLIMATWLGTASMWAIVRNLAAVALRCKDNGVDIMSTHLKLQWACHCLFLVSLRSPLNVMHGGTG